MSKKNLKSEENFDAKAWIKRNTKNIAEVTEIVELAIAGEIELSDEQLDTIMSYIEFWKMLLKGAQEC